MKGLRLRCPSTHTDIDIARRNGKEDLQSNPASGIENYVFHFVFDVVAPTDD